ncbi:MAG: DEAD/DEAH box helicase family protein [Planctomycetes bacterium]|nr:DEAD/DEAH box helicase family protein [Planctomycetota bacterium]
MPDNRFFEQPILNSPYEYPTQHWELDKTGQPTHEIIGKRRPVSFITPIPRAQRGQGGQGDLVLGDASGISNEKQLYHAAIINRVREHVDRWRSIPDPNQWGVSPETARLLQYWRHHDFTNIRPFFCQIEAVETAIWLTEVAPNAGKAANELLQHLADASEDANPGLSRLALKLATGAGKTTVMAMIIAWQTINAVHHPQSKRFTKGFLIVTPGITIRDRLRVLMPNDLDNYYSTRDLIPSEYLRELQQARIVITNFHSFKLRERLEVSKGGKSLLQGRGEAISTLESEGQMLQRVMPELLGMKGILVINDEAHHCYREKPGDDEGNGVSREDRDEADENNKAARLWISGLEAVQRHLGFQRIVDLSATPFFLQGSGYAEGTLFPWTMSDFSLMDAIEGGIVKLPRVPIADNRPDEEQPMFRNLWSHVAKDLPRGKRIQGKNLDPDNLPSPLRGALEALYGHYNKQFDLWQEAGVDVPPCFIIVCQNQNISKLVYDYVSGYERQNEDGQTSFVPGKLELFRNHDEHGQLFGRPRTLLIDSYQLESGDALDDTFRKFAATEIEQFRRERIARSGDQRAAEDIGDDELLREVMNTVGKPGKLGGGVRCVVSVAMLTEGWDTNTVTHVLGVRAFGTQLLCEQVIGRALRRQSYDLNERGLFGVEYADVFGIPFNFTAKAVPARPQAARETIQVRAMSPERDHLAIRFPRVQGYRIDLPSEHLAVSFSDDSTYVLTIERTGPSETKVAGIVGETVDMTFEHLKEARHSSIVMALTTRLITTQWKDENGDIKMHLYPQLKRIVSQWMDSHLRCEGGTYPAQVLYPDIADEVCERITLGIVSSQVGSRPIKVILDPYNPSGSTQQVNFTTSRPLRWKNDPSRSHINYAICDSTWELEFCRVAEKHAAVRRWVRNLNMGFAVPYQVATNAKQYIPDFILMVDDGHGADDLLHLVVEVKGYRREDAKQKKETMEKRWIPGVNNHGGFGRWAFAELTQFHSMEADLAAKVDELVGGMVDDATHHAPPTA